MIVHTVGMRRPEIPRRPAVRARRGTVAGSGSGRRSRSQPGSASGSGWRSGSRSGSALALATALTLLAACSGSEPAASPGDPGASVTPSAETPSSRLDPFTSGAPTEGSTDTSAGAPQGSTAPASESDPSSPDEVVATVEAVVESIEPVAETGVPGIESDDGFCRAWSEFAGSYQALTFAAGTDDPLDAARLEIVANDAVRSGAAGLATFLPGELEADRVALTETLTTPIVRRADRARELLAESGVDDDENARLGEVWLDALADQGLQTTDLEVTIDDRALDVAVREAAVTLADELPPIVEDPSLIVDVDLSALEAHLFDNCPDRGTLTGNDRTDG